MSLLMDALRRAENAKLESARNPQGDMLPTAADMLSLEPFSPEPAKGAPNPLPDLASHLAAVDADLAKSAVPEPRPVTTQPPPQPAKTAEARESVLALGTLGIAGISIAGYVWYQTNTMNRGSLATAPQSSPPRGQAALPTATVSVPAVPVSPPAVFATSDRSTAAFSPESSETGLFARRQAAPVRMPVAESDPSANTPIRLIRTRPEPDNNLARGHASLQRGETELSRREFEQVLQRDPNNTDALLALAAIAHNQGRPADAEGLRQRALVANPSDPAAQAAVLNNPAASADPHTAESRLKSLLSSQPESAPLNFALGNLYSRQGRWAEAQQVYFNAVAADGDNPDYLFNLAVSLDHLRQARLAAQHYKLALEASAKRPSGFARDKVLQRLGELQPERQP